MHPMPVWCQFFFRLMALSLQVRADGAGSTGTRKPQREELSFVAPCCATRDLWRRSFGNAQVLGWYGHGGRVARISGLRRKPRLPGGDGRCSRRSRWRGLGRDRRQSGARRRRRRRDRRGGGRSHLTKPSERGSVAGLRLIERIGPRLLRPASPTGGAGFVLAPVFRSITARAARLPVRLGHARIIDGNGGSAPCQILNASFARASGGPAMR
jgi:hypothetical protein